MAKRDEIVKLTTFIPNKIFVNSVLNNIVPKSMDMTWKDSIDIVSLYKVKKVMSLPLVTFIGIDSEISIDVEKFTHIGNVGDIVYLFKDNSDGDCLTISFNNEDYGDYIMDRLIQMGYINE